MFSKLDLGDLSSERLYLTGGGFSFLFVFLY